MRRRSFIRSLLCTTVMVAGGTLNRALMPEMAPMIPVPGTGVSVWLVSWDETGAGHRIYPRSRD